MDALYPRMPDGSDGGAVWSRRLADEFWSGAVTPLTFSLLAPAMVEQMVTRPLRIARLETLVDRPVFRLHASHVYVNASLLADVVDLLPGMLHSDGLLQLLPEEARARVRPATPFEGLTHAATIAAKFLWREPAWLPWRRLAAFDAACARVRAADAELVPAETIEQPSALIAEMRRTQDALGEYLAVVSWGVVFAYVSYHLLHELVRRWAPDSDADAAALTIGLPGVCSLDAHREVVALGTRIARTPGWSDADRDDIARRASRDQGEIGTAYRALLTRHGHRLTGRDLLHPTWREAPETVIGLALRSAQTADQPPPGVAEAAARRDRARQTIERRIAGGVDGLARRGVFRPTLLAAQRFCLVRENMRYHADFFLARLRALTLALGRRLLADPTDLFFCTDDELHQIASAAEGRGPSSDVATLVPNIDARRAAFANDARQPPPLTLDATISDTRRKAGVLPGEVGAPGRARGRAQLVRTVADFDEVRRGDVIVAAYADPAWTPMLDLASGLVLEAGGQLSHGAIVARELGIPALVNVQHALTTLQSGDLLEVDTGDGCVRRVARPDAETL